MNGLLDRIQMYLAALQDGPARLDHVEPLGLPVFLSKRYSFYRTKLFGKSWVLAVEAEDWDAGTPKEYGKQLRTVADAVGVTVVLVMGSATSTLRNRLVRMNTPFVVPGTQLFLPLAAINLTERYPSATGTSAKQLTPTAQLLVLYQILRGELHDLSSKDIAATLGCSGMMITKARAELEGRGICEVGRVGKEARMLFSNDARSLWETARTSLSSPIAKKRWVQWNRPVDIALRAGMTALSESTLIADDTFPTFAIKRYAFTDMLEQGTIHGWPDQNGAHALVECWKYDPCLLSDGPLVDPLSLYLSLRSEHSERVQGELESLLEKFPWR
jgi:hypothetical protein